MSKRTLDPMKMFVHADGFHKALFSLNAIDDPDIKVALGCPIGVMAAFASEIYLKCLLALEQKSVPGIHDLKSLFDLTSKDAQQRMEWHWKRILPMRIQLLNAIDAFTGHKVPRDLRTQIEMGARGFEKIRYQYEDANQEVTFMLTDFPSVLRGTIFDYKPEWKLIRRVYSKLPTSQGHSDQTRPDGAADPASDSR